MLTRRQALRSFAQFLAASPLLRADRKYSQSHDPLLQPINVPDFAKLAEAKLDPVAWDYLAEGSEDEVALADNRRRFDDLLLRPHFLRHDVSKIDISRTVLGKRWEHPIFICPAGGKNCFLKNGEQDAALGAAASNTMMITNGGINDFLASGKGPKIWFHFTTAAEFRNKGQMSEWVKKLEDQGASGISVTVDIYHVSHRERGVRHKFVRSWCQGGGIPRGPNGQLIYRPDDVIWSTGDYPDPKPFLTPTWETLQQLREASPRLPVIVKGVMTSEDTALAVQHGMSGVIVSNHGARQLDQVGATIEALPECVEAAGGRMPVLVDGGFRRGTDIVKALALGATAVGIARPYLWGLAAFGPPGVTRVMELLRAELATDMGMVGVGKISELNRSFVRLRR
jgi:isopentenyl diphosphate isomerase/L-lactate dehydrogenase-like FMN-dependent dehydrogenase